MIGYLEGTFRNGIVITESGVGYRVQTPPVNDGATVALWVHTAVSENAISLYGFENQDQLSIFQALIAIRGVGPKVALQIVAAADINQVVHYLSGANSLSVKGVGPKILDTIRREIKLPESIAAVAGVDPVAEALTNLGWDATRAQQAAAQVRGTYDGCSDSELLAHAIRGA